jgi:hypothetical protein
MATWRTIAASEVDPDSPVTATLMQALAENPVAITEGASGAPRLLYDEGTIGSYLFGYSTAGDTALGSTVAGSTLRATSALRSISNVTGAIGAFALNTSGTQSGTWRCMGQFDTAAVTGTAEYNGATLWLRIL